MDYRIKSLRSRSYWRYAVFSPGGVKSMFTWLGGIYFVVEALDFFGVYTRDQHGAYSLVLFVLAAFGLSLTTRRPTNRVTYKPPNRDLCVEIRVGDIFDADGAIIISSNTSFETDVAGGRISPNSLQGQFTRRYFNGRQDELAADIRRGLEKVEADGATPIEGRYLIGTVVPVHVGDRVFYFLAMADMDEDGNAETDRSRLEHAMDGLWRYARRKGELVNLSVPIIGSGRGRLNLRREKLIELTVQSFIEASREAVFARRLTVCVAPDDAVEFELNLWEIKDHLAASIPP